MLQDFSWYSPLLTAKLSGVTVDAIVFPRTIDQLELAISTSVRLGSPITIRGAGTGNYGQSVPVHGGLLVDMRNFTGVTSISDSAISVRAGTRIVVAENAARSHGRELRLLPTTYRKSQAAGFVAGGAGGLGSITHGMIWDGNILSADVLTVEERPRQVHVGPEDIDVLLHTYGTVAVITDLEFPLEPAHEWREMGAVFADFEQAAAFAWAFGQDASLPKRLLGMGQAPAPALYRPVRNLYNPTDHLVVFIVESGKRDEAARMVADFGGSSFDWPANPEISQFAFAHSVLWAKHEDSSVSWLQLQWSADEAECRQQVGCVNSYFGDRLLLDFTFITRGGALRAGSVALLPRATEASIAEAIEVCEGFGVGVKNPHTYLVHDIRDGSPASDTSKAALWKRQLDPFGLLNPGKLAP